MTMGFCRNEAYQDVLWEKSIEMVKDFLSSSTLAKYGETRSVAQTEPQS